MKTISRYIMTLALLLTAVTGAWAEEKSETIPTTTSQEVYTGEHFKITPDRQKDMLTVADLRNYEDGQVFFFIETLDGQNISKLDLQINNIIEASIDNLSLSSGTKSYDSNKNVLTITNVNADFVQITLTEGDKYGVVTFSSVTYYYEESPSGPEVAWDPATKTGTFEMPANDVVLTPIYSAATIYSDQTETPFETLKEAFANVQDGDVIKLDWNVTLTETVETLHRDGAIKFTLDLNGYIIDGMTPEYAIRLRNGDLMTITDSSLGQTGGLKCQDLVGEQGAMFIFDGGRYTMGQLTADLLNAVCSGATAALLLAPGKEFTDIENAPDADGFTVRVGFKTFDLAIDSKRFATFYNDMNIKFAEQPAEGVGLYTISSIDADRSTATVTPISGIIPAGTPMLVYNGTEQKQTAKLIVTLDNAQDAVVWAPQFKGTATEKDFTAADMEAADYYALSGGKAFAPVKGAGTLGANQCWLQFDKQEIPSARQFTLVFDETTGVSEKGIVNSEKFATYTIDGRKVNVPSKKGIYIMNGKKVVVK
ncbi:hypothetical protein L6470_00180 [Prevotella communis]|uniref:hypothetical protein n=1 Tax=Prevotella communis TaxID=2913614 RepID=UPI001EDB641C|nr:hypothetical protein [Prevotella communis]UKK59464.1 hypothetical protein L6470_00180 [Prevotella communis]